jgi:type II secretory pathway predicted ATPase ExeA
MFSSLYGLSFNPFDKHFLKDSNPFLSQDHKETVARLNYLIKTRGIGLFTASPGLGKSYALRCFAGSLDPNLFSMHYICLSTVSVVEFYKQLCDILGLDSKGGKTVMFKAIQSAIYDLHREKRKTFILAVDEAQYLSHGILRDLKMLMNFNYDALNCFTLILAGEPFLNDIIRRQPHEALRQRITTHYEFAGLSGNEVSDYIAHKLSSANASNSIIDPAALSALQGYCEGNPRIIDNIMTDAFDIGAQLGKNIIDSEIIRAVLNAQSLA